LKGAKDLFSLRLVHTKWPISLLKGIKIMTIYTTERAAWEAAAVGYMLKNASLGQSFEDTAATAGRLADALILEMRKRQSA
jgi:hypothetical protein